MDRRGKIAGVLYGLALGDALGMPPEFLSQEEIKRKYGRITDFLDGDPENAISRFYKAGQYTDDTGQALAVLDSLTQTDFVPEAKNIGAHLLTWADREDAFQKGLLGPTSSQVLTRIKAGEDPQPIARQAVTNGAAMRIAPVGTLFDPDQMEALCRYVADISMVTHASDAAICGACMIAMAVSSAVSGEGKEEMIKRVLLLEPYARTLGADTDSPSLSPRVKKGVAVAEEYTDDPEGFASALSRLTGSGADVWESVPAALCIAYYGYEDPKKSAVFSANFGGDTDTIGAMATAICGGAAGVEGIADSDIEVLKEANQVDFTPYVDALFRHSFAPRP